MVLLPIFTVMLEYAKSSLSKNQVQNGQIFYRNPISEDLDLLVLVPQNWVILHISAASIITQLDIIIHANGVYTQKYYSLNAEFRTDAK